MATPSSLRAASSSLLRSTAAAGGSSTSAGRMARGVHIAAIRPSAQTVSLRKEMAAISAVRHASSSSSSSSTSSSSPKGDSSSSERSPYTSYIIAGSIAVSFIGYLAYTSRPVPSDSPKRGLWTSRMKNVVGGAKTILRKATGTEVDEEESEEEVEEEEEEAKAEEADPLANAEEPSLPGGGNDGSSLDPIAKVVSEDVGPDTEEGGQAAAFNPATGEINWDCPCLGGMATGPCGEEFKEAFACFVYSEKEPKGIECVDRFAKMQECFRRHPEVYKEELEGQEDEDAIDGLIAEAENVLGYPPLTGSVETPASAVVPATVGA